MTETQRKKYKGYTQEERLKKFSRYYTCDPETIERLNITHAEHLMLHKGSWGDTLKGFFRPRNPKKYVGNTQNIIYRSSFELQLMRQFDDDPDVISWASEELAIPYYNKVKKRPARYFPDFVVKKKINNGEKILCIEVKPFNQTIAPKPSKGNRSKRRFINESLTFQMNTDKWEAAKEFCERQGWEFIIMTENEIFGKDYHGQPYKYNKKK